VHFAADTQQFLCYNEAGELIKQLGWKGDLRTSLLGQSGATFNLPCFQLHLPFSWQDIRDQHFWRVACDTTI
jgi:hypothetical protein